MLAEFREFIAKGNVMDMAVGIIIGAAFTAIVTSLVEDLINPLIGIFLGGVDFGGLSASMGDATFTYGNFIMAVINFLIVAWVVFLLVKMVNRVKDAATAPEEEAEEEPAGPTAEELLTEIRDALQTR
ncbi:MAG: large-conductance mechanosensitive channel protein MscL [Pseudomonadota bacterium]